MNQNRVISLKEIDKSYKVYDRKVIHRLQDIFFPSTNKKSQAFFALEDINLTVNKGEILGIVGRNGSGKSTLLKIISGITVQSKGDIEVKGNVIPLLELGGGFNPEYTGRENIYLNCALLGLKKEEIDARYQDIVDFSELEDFIDMPIKKYSSGMKARLGFAVSINIDPDILILDEVLSVGDELFKRKCFVKMQSFFNSGKTILFVSHNSESIINICTRVILLHKGEKLLDGSPDFVMEQYSRLLNCGKDKESYVVESIRMGQKKKKNKSSENRISMDDSLLLKPKSTRIVQKKNIALISAHLTDKKKKETHLLEWGKKYNLQFLLQIKEQVERFRVEVILHDDQSRRISECIYPHSYESDIVLKKNQTLDFSCNFNANLRPGLYGITFVIRHMETGKIKDAIKISDIILFKMIEKTISSKSPAQLFEKKIHFDYRD